MSIKTIQPRVSLCKRPSHISICGSCSVYLRFFFFAQVGEEGWFGMWGQGFGGSHVERKSTRELWTCLRGIFLPMTLMALLLCWGGALRGAHLSESVAAMIGLHPAGVLRSSWVAFWSDQRQLFPRNPLTASSTTLSAHTQLSTGESSRKALLWELRTGRTSSHF